MFPLRNKSIRTHIDVRAGEDKNRHQLEDFDIQEMLEYERNREGEWVVVPSQPIRRWIKQDTLQVPQIKHSGVLSTDGRFESIIGSDILGPGLKTDIGEYNSFLNVIVQTLWHLRAFREEFMSRSTSEHVHIGDPCVVCELQEIFIALSVASANNEREAISSTPLRNALIKLHPDSNYFQEAHIYDASKILRTILDCLHASFTLCPGVSDATQSPERKYAASSWGCGSDASIAHKHFGKDILEKMVCSNCAMVSVERQYTSWMYGIHAISLRTMKNMHPESSFDELFKLSERNYYCHEKYLVCRPDKGGCENPMSLCIYLKTPPQVFVIGLLWRSNENRDDISAILEALNTEIDMAVLHDGLPPGNKHSLLSMQSIDWLGKGVRPQPPHKEGWLLSLDELLVCYFGQHFICFAHSHEHEKWIMYDDETVKLIGCWDDVISMCEGQRLQPQLLFFEAVKNRDGNSNRSDTIPCIPHPARIGVPGISSMIESYLVEKNKNRSGIGLQTFYY